MTQASTLMPRRKPYMRLISQLNKALGEEDFRGIDRYALAALAVIRSMGIPYFCPCDSLFKSQVKQIQELESVHHQVFLGMLKAALGPDKGKITKFALDAERYKSLREREMLHFLSGAEMLFFSCRVGMFQMPVWELVSVPQYFVDGVYLSIYLSDPSVQIRDTARILEGLTSICHGRFSDALGLFCFQFFDDNSGEIVKRVREIANTLREKYEEAERPGE
jgi:hypothetical protein